MVLENSTRPFFGSARLPQSTTKETGSTNISNCGRPYYIIVSQFQSDMKYVLCLLLSSASHHQLDQVLKVGQLGRCTIPSHQHCFHLQHLWTGLSVHLEPWRTWHHLQHWSQYWHHLPIQCHHIWRIQMSAARLSQSQPGMCLPATTMYMHHYIASHCIR